MKKTIPAVAYYRMSDDKQVASIPEQKAAVEEWARKHGYTILRFYQDEGISGDQTKKRKAFQKMIADAEHGDFKAILVWDIDRFGRFDSIEAGRWIYPLREAGVHLATVTEGVIDWTTFAGRMSYGFKQEAKHLYLTDLSNNVTRSFMTMAQQGKWASGKPPIGYVVENKQLKLGSTEDVQFVKDLFAQYLEGKSLRSLASQFYVEGRLSPKHKRWTVNGLSGVLKNRMYTGDFVWNVHCISKYRRNGRASQRNDKADWIVIEDHHEAIIDKQTFARVQDELKSRKSASTPHIGGGQFVLSGLLVCGHCGYKMIGDTANRALDYTCYGYRQLGASFCESHRVRQSEVLKIVLEVLERDYFNPKTMERLKAICRQKVEAAVRHHDADKLDAELSSVEVKLAKAKKRLVEVDVDLIGDVQDQIRELKGRRDRLSERLLEEKQPKGKRLRDAEDRIRIAMENFSKLKQAVGNGKTEQVRQFLRDTVQKIEIFTEKVPWTAKRFKHRIVRGAITIKSLQPVQSGPPLVTPYTIVFHLAA